MIDRINLSVQTVKVNVSAYVKILKILLVRRWLYHWFLTWLLIFQRNYILIAIYLGQKQAIDSILKAKKEQINFTENLLFLISLEF